MTTVQEATKALWDHINSLGEEQKAAATAYQKRLESEAETHPEGMLGVIRDHIKHNSMSMVEAATDYSEHLAGVITEATISGIKHTQDIATKASDAVVNRINKL